MGIKNIKVKTDKSFINPQGRSRFTKENYPALAKEIIKENPIYQQLIGPDMCISDKYWIYSCS